MELSFGSRLKHAWNAFNRDPTTEYSVPGQSYYYRPDKARVSRSNNRSIATAVYNRIALDVAAINIKHCRMDSNGRYISDISSGLNDCLTLEANLDQTHRDFIQDVVLSMFDEGAVAIVPVETTFNPSKTGAYDILSMRTGKLVEWKPEHVKVRVYNEKTGEKEEIWMPKRAVAIIPNPLYSVMNEPNSTMQRLIRKINLLDQADEESAAGKLDMIIQLPYVIKTDARRAEAEKRRKDIEMQLTGSKYGIAYTDGTEKITQLNRPVENNLVAQIENLTNQLFAQLGITQEILNGTADEKVMLNYYNRSIEPIVSAIVDEMKRKFLTKTARTQLQTIAAFRDPFKLVPVNDIAEIADKFTRNEIMTSNEIRQVIGMKPSQDPKADQLVNSNISQPVDQQMPMEDGTEEPGMTQEDYDSASSELDNLDSQLDDLENSLGHTMAFKGDDMLLHYASPYYDPEKAHEYYMKNRELKGRSRLNEEGRNVKKIVKQNITEEYRQKVDEHKKSTDSQINTLREQKTSEIKSNTESMKSEIKSLKTETSSNIEKYRSEMQSKIDTLNTSLKGASDDQKVQIRSQIAELRAENKQKRAALNEAFSESRSELQSDNRETTSQLNSDFKTNSTSLRTAHKEEKARLNEERNQKLSDEYDKIHSEAAYQYQKKSSGSKKSSSSTKGDKLAKYRIKETSRYKQMSRYSEAKQTQDVGEIIKKLKK